MSINLEPVPFGNTYSMRNIPVPGRKEHKTKTIKQTGKFVKNVRWAGLFAKHGGQIDSLDHPDLPIILERKETFGFKSGNAPPIIPEFLEFEKELWNIVKNIKYFNRTNEFQKMLKKDLDELSKLDKIVVFADKTNNLYCLDKADYLKVAKDNITRDYQITDSAKVNIVNQKAANIAKDVGQEKNMEIYCPSEAFFTIKDHKDDFPSKIKVRVINPAKTDVGKISKHYLQNIVQEVNMKLKLHQWRSSNQVKEWFRNIRSKRGATFLKFDIESFYPSISKELFERALLFAKKYCTISEADMKAIRLARESFLYHQGQPWEKKGNDNFDIAMGAYDGAECCELVGLYLLNKITAKGSGVFSKMMVGLYRDDGLSIVRGGPGEVERVTKKLHKLFETEGLKITCEAGKQGTDYLDLYFDLKHDKYRQWRKPNSNPLYVHKDSNHPPQVLKEIPNMIEKMVSKNSSTKAEFDKVKREYQNSLKNSGFDKKLHYKPDVPKPKVHKRNKKKLWFNPPWSDNMRTSLGHEFLALVDKYREKFKGTVFEKIFSRATMKISYSTTRNMKAHISSHNMKILNRKEDSQPDSCNCRANGPPCPLGGECQVKSIVYKATVTTKEDSPIIKTYHGMTGGDFKSRFSGHKHDMKNRDKYGTTLSRHIWRLRDMGIRFEIKWEIKEKAQKYNPGGKDCKLCSAEKYHILMEDDKRSLNVRSELLSKCRHRAKWKLDKLIL